MTHPELLWPLPRTLEDKCSPRQSAPVCHRLQVQGRLKNEPWEAMQHLVTKEEKGFQDWQDRQNWKFPALHCCPSLNKKTVLGNNTAFKALCLRDSVGSYIPLCICSDIWPALKSQKSFNPPHMVLFPSRLWSGKCLAFASLGLGVYYKTEQYSVAYCVTLEYKIVMTMIVIVTIIVINYYK